MITQHELDAVADTVKAQGLSEQVLSGLKLAYPGKHFTWCLEDDIHVGKPVYSAEEFAIYLVNSSQHCSVLTNDLDSASGFVLAEIIPD